MSIRSLGLVVALTLVGGCEHKQSNRWPDHRKLEEQRITDLEKEMVVVKDLEKRVHDLEAAAHSAPPGPLGP